MSHKKTRKPLESKNTVLKAIIEIFANEPYRNFNIRQIANKLNLSDKSSRNIVHSYLESLAFDSVINRISKSSYILNPVHIAKFHTTKEVIGEVEMKSSGKAYIINTDLADDVFIDSGNTGLALDGDKVKVQLFPARNKRKPEGRIMEVIERRHSHFVGVIEVSKNFAFLIPDKDNVHVDFFIPHDKVNGAKNGEKVVVKITDWPANAKNPIAEVEEVLGAPGNHEVEMKSILASNDYPLSFPKQVLADAEKIPTELDAKEIKKRKDFRNVWTCTIDPVDAKDFDDALSLMQLDGGIWQIGVHIADVSYYVRPKTALDKEAYDRGTSVYLVDRVIPMLPEKLSNMVCSLRPNEDKFTFSAVFDMTEEGQVVKEWFGKTVINSNRRYSYEEVQEMLEGADGDFKSELLVLDKIAKRLRNERFSKGSIAFRSQEVKFKLDENGKPLEAFVKEQKDAHKLIEDFMLLANRKVAEKIAQEKAGKKEAKTFVYRIHDKPNEEKLQVFSEFLKKFGYKLSLSSRKSLVTSFNNLFEEIRGKGEEHMIETIAVRTMAKAIYSTKNIGHYGLAFKDYTHFTSPIRRYPDLMSHRLLEMYMAGGQSVDASEYEEYCKHSSDMERKAADAERESVKFKQAEYMADKVGKVFTGLISGVTKYGLFVEVDGIKAEGLVSIHSLTDDYYFIDDENYQIVGRRKGKIYRLGDKVRVKVQKVDILKKQMDFTLVKEIEDALKFDI